MENHQASLDAAFHALSDPTRRAVVGRLAARPATVSDLAQPFDIGLPAFLKHLKVLEDCGLIHTVKRGRTRHCQIAPARLAEAEDWLSRQRAQLQAQVDRLADYVEISLKDDDHG